MDEVDRARRRNPPWCHGVDANALWKQILGQCAGEADNSTLARRVVDHCTGAAEGDDGSGVDDTAKEVSVPKGCGGPLLLFQAQALTKSLPSCEARCIS